MKPAIRCAIYTRKSSEEGLDQDFNSLDAQRDACAAYVLSQAGEGWNLIPERFDDGGFSGGNIERPAMKRLLELVRKKQIDVIVVYKVDRLTRSLGDFARIVEMLDAAGASFVSVTQAFNTTTSMGRLTLNVLLSFAQFEREVTGERIRDKIAASKARGMWMGGGVPLGYDAEGRTLKINSGEAETVRAIFARYLEIGSVHLLVPDLQSRGVVSKRQIFTTGRVRGGVPMTRGALYYLLSNRVYLGKIPHKGVWHDGLHPALLDPVLFDAVQVQLAENSNPRRNDAVRAPTAPLVGKLFDADGTRLTPVAAKARRGVTYRYYVDARSGPGPKRRRLPAGPLETLVAASMEACRLVVPCQPPDWSAIRDAVDRVDMDGETMILSLSVAATARVRRPEPGSGLEVRRSEVGVKIIVPARLERGRGGVVISEPEALAPWAPIEDDRVLIKALARAEAWKVALRSGEVAGPRDLARQENLSPNYFNRILRLAFLAPRIKRAILEGRRPTALTLQRIVDVGVDLSWDRQWSGLAVTRPSPGIRPPSAGR